MSKLKYYFMPSRWRSFMIYVLRKVLKRLDNSEWTPEVHEVEQFMFRYLTCSDCLEYKKCVHSDCGCKMPERAHVWTDHCPTGKWGPIFDKDKWENFKSRSEIEFSLIKK